MAAAPLVLMTAGGTGGHVYPALAVAQDLLLRGYRVHWVGTRRGLEHRVVPAAGITLHCLPVQGLRGKSFLHRLAGVFALVLAAGGALWLVLRLRPRCVVGMGGYAAGPAGIAAWLLRRPLLIHEQNAVAGTTNRMLAPLARRIVAGFPGAFGPRRNCTVTGNPLRRELLEAGAGATYDFDGARPLRLLVLGGSLGAAPINEVLPGMVRRLERTSPGAVAVLHQTGEAHLETTRARYGSLIGRDVRIEPFIDDMVSAYLWADLVLCRAGALTVAELAAMGRPSILVPLPQAIDDHQTANARSLGAVGAALVLLQNQLDAYKLASLLREFIAEPERLARMSAAARSAATPEATRRVAGYCEELING